MTAVFSAAADNVLVDRADHRAGRHCALLFIAASFLDFTKRRRAFVNQMVRGVIPRHSLDRVRVAAITVPVG